MKWRLSIPSGNDDDLRIFTSRQTTRARRGSRNATTRAADGRVYRLTNIRRQPEQIDGVTSDRG
jgi:hypothetical protein